MNRENPINHRAGAAIDAALHSAGTAEPPSGLEGRILTRLAAERMRTGALPARLLFPSRLSRAAHASVPVLCGLCGCLLCVVVIAGSLSHSRHLHRHSVLAPPVLALPGQGIGAASAVHPAAPASTPAPPGQAGRGRAQRRGRARIAPHAHKAPGVAVPAPNSSDSQN